MTFMSSNVTDAYQEIQVVNDTKCLI